MRGYRLEDIENVDTDQGCRGYRSESGYRSGTGYRSELYICTSTVCRIFISHGKTGKKIRNCFYYNIFFILFQNRKKQKTDIWDRADPFGKGITPDEIELKFDNGKCLYVSKGFLIYSSPVFERMFQVILSVFMLFEPPRGKTNNVVFEHKPACAVTEDGWRPENLDLESRGIVLSL